MTVFRRMQRGVLGVLSLAITSLTLAGVEAPAASSATPTRPAMSAEVVPTYTNPVGDDAAENFADPSVIRGRDGYWYAYATGDPRFAGVLKRVGGPAAP